MRTVIIRLSGKDFAPAIVRMRDWLEKYRCEPTAYRYDQDDDTVVVSVDFAVDAQAKAFAKHFDGQSDQRPVSRPLSDAVGVSGIGGV
jgi:hypothetical protein